MLCYRRFRCHCFCVFIVFVDEANVKKSHSYAFILRKYLAQTRKITHSTFQSHHKRDRGMRARAREEDVKGEKSQNRLQRKRK